MAFKVKTKNQHKLLMQGIKLNEEAQTLHNRGEYEESRKLKNQANKILGGFDDDDVAEHYKLRGK